MVTFSIGVIIHQLEEVKPMISRIILSTLTFFFILLQIKSNVVKYEQWETEQMPTITFLENTWESAE